MLLDDCAGVAGEWMVFVFEDRGVVLLADFRASLSLLGTDARLSPAMGSS